jgi:hypothetical protein
MDGRIIGGIEMAVDAGAAAVLAAAVAYACHAIPVSQANGALAAVASLGLCFAGLRRIPTGGSPDAEVEQRPVTELLAEADRAIEAEEQDELVLDDILSALSSDSRVVRLFDPEAPPPPGAPKDDSQVLYDALRELRRSLS